MNCSFLIISGEDLFSKDQTKSNQAKPVIRRVPLSCLHYAALFQSDIVQLFLQGAVRAECCIADLQGTRTPGWLTDKKYIFPANFHFPGNLWYLSQHHKKLMDIIDPFVLAFSLTAVRVQNTIVKAMKIDP